MRGCGGTFLKKFPHNRIPLLFLHLSQEQKHRSGEDDKGVAENPPQVRKDARIVACNNGALHFDGVDEGKSIGDLFENAAHKVEVEPNAREPRREVCQKRSADAANLFVVKHASAEQTERDI